MKKYKVFAFITIVSVLLLDIFVNKAYAISNDPETYTNYEEFESISCGGMVSGIPAVLPKIVSIVYILIEIMIPVVLVILGSIDLIKAVTADKEENIKKAQGVFFKRLISAVLIFFVLSIVKMVVGLVADDDTKSRGIADCISCFIRNDSNCIPDK